MCIWSSSLRFNMGVDRGEFERLPIILSDDFSEERSADNWELMSATIVREIRADYGHKCVLRG